MQCQKGNYMAHSTHFHFSISIFPFPYESINPPLKSSTEGKKVVFIYILQSYNFLKY